jgi:hypothetical protein
VTRRQWVIVGIAVFAAVALGGWLLVNRLYPVPSSLVGRWENETPIMAAGPGEVQLTIHRDGLAVAEFDRSRYEWWGPTRFRLLVRGDELTLWTDPPDRDDQPVTLRIEITDERIRVWDPAHQITNQDELVFRRVPRP